MTVLFDEKTHGSIADTLSKLVDQLASIDWFTKVDVTEKAAEEQVRHFLSALNVTEYEIKWISRENVEKVIDNLTFEGSDVWATLKELPDQLKKTINKADRNSLLESMVEIIPESVYHRAFDGAFNQFDNNKKIVQYLVGNAMYVSVIACTAAIAEEKELFEPLLKLIESGHTVLGLEKNIIYLL